MPKLLRSDIQTTEVFDWKGFHLLHFMGSSCSQKTRIFMNLKGIDWTSRHVDVPGHENYSDWYMGINPRGLVPAMVHDGDVIIESNDIMEYVEALHPEPKLIPDGANQEVHDLLKEEDDLHLDLRTLSMRYVFGPRAGIRSAETLEKYETLGSGTVMGERDAHKDVELKFFKDMVENQGVPDENIKTSAHRFKTILDKLDQRLAKTPYILGDTLSLVDIAWYIYGARLRDASYPLHAEHPNFAAFFDRLDAQPAFSKEVAAPPPMVAAREKMHAEQAARGESLAQVAGLKTA